jgi:hypothetical protein
LLSAEKLRPLEWFSPELRGHLRRLNSKRDDGNFGSSPQGRTQFALHDNVSQAAYKKSAHAGDALHKLTQRGIDCVRAGAHQVDPGIKRNEGSDIVQDYQIKSLMKAFVLNLYRLAPAVKRSFKRASEGIDFDRDRSSERPSFSKSEFVTVPGKSEVYSPLPSVVLHDQTRQSTAKLLLQSGQF